MYNVLTNAILVSQILKQPLLLFGIIASLFVLIVKIGLYRIYFTLGNVNDDISQIVATCLLMDYKI